MSQPKTIVVGMSGGVDSSVAALLLKQQGHRVVGMFMKNWDETDPETGACTAEADSEDARRVCDQLDIPYYGIEFVREYWDNVFKRFVAEYEAGLTPNPDILCNREIKFKAFYEKAMALGGDALATGHYARTEGGKLLKGLDPGKDQSYFLYAIDGRVLDRTLFPIGHLPKAEVRELARSNGLPTHDKKDSTGICFIGERDFRSFLSKYVSIKPGEMRTLDGKVVGKHQGAAFYTLGQRKGLGLGGEGEPFFVVAKDPKKNILFVERGKDHPALYADELVATELNWIAGSAPKLPHACRAKARYRQADQECVIEADSLDPGSMGARLRVRFIQPQRSLTPGQSVVFYDGDVCLGGGVIESIGPSYFEQGRELPVSRDVADLAHSPS